MQTSNNGGYMTATSNSSATTFAELWKQAVEGFIIQARLSEREQASLKRCPTVEEALNLNRHGWGKNITDKQWQAHEAMRNVVPQVLRVFKVIDVVLGLAQGVCPISQFKLI
jgi:hypothetical protein